MIIDGSFTIQSPVQEVWSFLIDFERVSACMPGVDKVWKIDDQSYAGTVTVKVGPIAAAFQGNVVKTVEEAPTLLKVKLQGKDAKTASMVTGEFSSELADAGARRTDVKYKFDIAIRGKLGQFGQAVILDTSRQLTDEFVACLRSRIERPDAPVEPAAAQADLFWMAVRAFFSSLWMSLKRVFRRA